MSASALLDDYRACLEELTHLRQVAMLQDAENAKLHERIAAISAENNG